MESLPRKFILFNSFLIFYFKFYSSRRHLKEPEAVLEAILKSKLSVLPGHIQAVFIHNLMKLYAHIRHTASTIEARDRAHQVRIECQSDVITKGRVNLGFRRSC